MSKGEGQAATFAQQGLAASSDRRLFASALNAASEHLRFLRLDRRVVANGIAAAAALALHALIFVPLLAYGSGSASEIPRLGAGTVIHGVILEAVTHRSIISKPRLTPGTLQAMSVDAISDPSHSEVVTGANAIGGGPGLAALYGRYLGQVRARIERAWLRPRTVIGSDLFRCRVRIDQDPSGRVGEVILQRCNGTPEWQQSLVRAIADASPLSAPPNPAIFTPHIDLEFRSTAYAPGALNETFMAPPPPAVRAVNNAAVMLRTIRALRKQPFARAPGRSVIELNINGSQIHITTMHYPRKRGKHRRKKGRTPHGQRSSGLEDP